MCVCQTTCFRWKQLPLNLYRGCLGVITGQPSDAAPPCVTCCSAHWASCDPCCLPTASAIWVGWWHAAWHPWEKRPVSSFVEGKRNQLHDLCVLCVHALMLSVFTVQVIAGDLLIVKALSGQGPNDITNSLHRTLATLTLWSSSAGLLKFLAKATKRLEVQRLWNTLLTSPKPAL